MKLDSSLSPLRWPVLARSPGARPGDSLLARKLHSRPAWSSPTADTVALAEKRLAKLRDDRRHRSRQGRNSQESRRPIWRPRKRIAHRRHRRAGAGAAHPDHARAGPRRNAAGRDPQYGRVRHPPVRRRLRRGHRRRADRMPHRSAGEHAGRARRAPGAGFDQRLRVTCHQRQGENHQRAADRGGRRAAKTGSREASCWRNAHEPQGCCC